MKNNIQRVLAIVFFISGLFFILKPLFLAGHPDYYVYFSTAKSFLAGKNIYVPSSGASFIYPPFALFFILPFTLFPYGLSQIIWTGLSIAAYLTSLLLLFHMENEKLFSNRFLLLVGLACYSFPAKFTLGMGQINTFILLLVTLFLYFQKTKKNRLAALSLAVSLNTKFFPFFFFLEFIQKKQWKVLLSTVVFSIILFGVALSVFHVSSLIQFINSILPGIVNSTRTDYYNQALSGFIFRLFSVSNLSEIIIMLTSFVLLSITVYVMWKTRKKQFLLVFGLLITLHLLIDSFSWQHYFVWLVIPFVQLFYTISKYKSRKMYIPLILSYFLTQTNLKNPSSYPVFLQSHVFYGTLILWGYILYILNCDDKHTLSH